jgi:broad specificity phosphatase PhoE
MHLTFIRHGETEWNAAKRFQGRSDIPLSQTGRDQARAVARALRDQRFDRIYASDLRRAHETAAIVAEPHGLAVVTEPRWREFDFGDWEGLTWDEIVATRPHLNELGATAAKLFVPENGESFDEVKERVGDFLASLRAQPSAEHVAIVTHAGPLHAMLTVLDLVPSDEHGEPLGVNFRQASITRVAMNDGAARLITLSDVQHLDSPG